MTLDAYAIKTYEKVLNGEQKAFSPYFFHPQHRKERVTDLIKYLIEQKLDLTPENALTKLTLTDLEKYKLKCLLRYIDKPVEFSKNNVKHLVYCAYPHLERPGVEELAIMVYQDVLTGKRRTFPKNYFLNGQIGEQRAIICFKYLCEEILRFSKEEILEQFSGTKGSKILAEHKLKIIMNILFLSMSDLLETCYPDILTKE